VAVTRFDHRRLHQSATSLHRLERSGRSASTECFPVGHPSND